MDVIIKVNNQSNGRDKLARLFQYTSRLVWHQLETRNANKYSVDRIRNLELALSSFRKSIFDQNLNESENETRELFKEKKENCAQLQHYILMLKLELKLLRLGRCIDTCYTAFDSMHIEDPFLRIALTVSKLAHGLYLYADHVVWLTKSGFLKTDTESWNKTANRFWLLSIIANLARDIYEILHVLEFNSSSLLKPSELLSGPPRSLDLSSSVKHIHAFVNCHKDIFIDTIKNSCDLFIPLTALGFTKLSPSAVGMLGAMSSIAALVTIFKPITKLVP